LLFQLQFKLFRVLILNSRFIPTAFRFLYRHQELTQDYPFLVFLLIIIRIILANPNNILNSNLLRKSPKISPSYALSKSFL